MSQPTGASRAAAPTTTDPSIRERRIDALQRALRARQILDHADALAGGGGAGEGSGDRHLPEPERDPGPTPEPVDGDPDAADAADAPDVPDGLVRLLEIHQSLQHERQAARRPFHRHSDRLVLALELAERLALDRLGYDDFADFENRDQNRRGLEVLDLDQVEQAQRDLAAAEATLAELDGLEGVDRIELRLPTWTIDPVLRDPVRRRTTRMRRHVFGPAEHHDDGGPDAPIDGAGTAPGPAPLPFRRPPVQADVGQRDLRGPEAQEQAQEQDRVLGEIVRNGRVVRVEKVGGLVYREDDDHPGTDAITYGHPDRPG